MKNQRNDKPVRKNQLIAQVKIKEFLFYMGEDVTREGLKDTPKRFTKFYDEFCSPPAFNFTTFKNDGGTDQMIIVKSIPFYSICEHHLAPFFGTASIGYLPKKKIVGLSKLPRTLELFARRPQNQERIGTQVADFLMKNLDCHGVGIMISARHMCMEMRGVEKPGAETITSCLRGVFKKDNVKAEFFNLISK